MNIIRLVALLMACWLGSICAQEAPVQEASSVSFRGYFQNEWQKSKSTDVYLPMHTWHNRNYYSAAEIKTFNEIPSGLGIGQSYKDEEGHWRGYYAMLFTDSFYKTEPIAGYFYAHKLVGTPTTFNIGLGYTLFLTAREDSHYFPLPGIAPLVTAGYKNLTINASYLPGKVGVGNIGFLWLVYSFKQ